MTKKQNVKGAAAEFRDGSMVMFINPTYHNNVGGFRDTLRKEQRSGFKTATDKKITNDFSYTARHEYGHLTQYSITKKTGKSAQKIKNEVQSYVRKSGSKSISPSRYGATNKYEFFAESFASMTGGKPNTHGKALAQWFKNNK